MLKFIALFLIIFVSISSLLLFAPIPEIDKKETRQVFSKAHSLIDQIETLDKKELIDSYINQSDLDKFIVDYKDTICTKLQGHTVRKDCKPCIKVSNRFNKNYKKLCKSIDKDFSNSDKLFSFYKNSAHILNLEYKHRLNLEKKERQKVKDRKSKRIKEAKKSGKLYIAKIEHFEPLPPIEIALREDFYTSLSEGILIGSNPNTNYHEERKKIYNSISPILRKIIRSPAQEAIPSIKELAIKSKEYKKSCDKYQQDPLFYAECASKFINNFNHNKLNSLLKLLQN